MLQPRAARTQRACFQEDDITGPPSCAWCRHAGSATQTPMQRHVITADGGAPVLVDPSLYGACIRLPLRGCKDCRVQGLEFVFKGRESAWLQRQQPGGRASNFFAELPRVV